jgi:hypothetical protein
MSTQQMHLQREILATLNSVEVLRVTGGDGGGSYQPPTAPEDQPPTIGASLIAGLVNH